MSTKYLLHKLDYRRYFSSVLFLVLFICIVNLNQYGNTRSFDRTTREDTIEKIQNYFPSFPLVDLHDSGGSVDNLRQIELYNNAISNVTENTEDQMSARKALLKKVCSVMKNGTINPPSPDVFNQEYLEHLIVSQEKEFLYCYLPKVANTNFRRVLLGIQGVVPKSKVAAVAGESIYPKYKNDFTYLKDVDANKKANMLEKYKKFIVVRDPLVRLLSAYRNKIVLHPSPTERMKFYRRIVNFYDKHPQLNRSFAHDDVLTFENFLTYWTDIFDANAFINEHFTPFYLLCKPCDIDYDYIAKYETLDKDVDYMFDKLKIDIEFPGRNDNYSNLNTDTLVEDYYKNISGSLLEKLWRVLKFDFVLFGYNLPGWFKEKINV